MRGHLEFTCLCVELIDCNPYSCMRTNWKNSGLCGRFCWKLLMYLCLKKWMGIDLGFFPQSPYRPCRMMYCQVGSGRPDDSGLHSSAGSLFCPLRCFQKCNSSFLFCTVSPLFIVVSLLMNFIACPLCGILCHICRQLFATFLKTRSRAIPLNSPDTCVG